VDCVRVHVHVRVIAFVFVSEHMSISAGVSSARAKFVVLSRVHQYLFCLHSVLSRVHQYLFCLHMCAVCNSKLVSSHTTISKRDYFRPACSLLRTRTHTYQHAHNN
jgi:hypothetical protein